MRDANCFLADFISNDSFVSNGPYGLNRADDRVPVSYFACMSEMPYARFSLSSVMSWEFFDKLLLYMNVKGQV